MLLVCWLPIRLLTSHLLRLPGEMGDELRCHVNLDMCTHFLKIKQLSQHKLENIQVSSFLTGSHACQYLRESHLVTGRDEPSRELQAFVFQLRSGFHC